MRGVSHQVGFTQVLLARHQLATSPRVGSGLVAGRILPNCGVVSSLRLSRIFEPVLVAREFADLLTASPMFFKQPRESLS